MKKIAIFAVSLVLSGSVSAQLTITENQPASEGVAAAKVDKVTWLDSQGLEREAHIATKVQEHLPGAIVYYSYGEPKLEIKAESGGDGITDVSHYPEGANRTVSGRSGNDFHGLEWIFRGENHAILRAKYRMTYHDKEKKYGEKIGVTRDFIFVNGCDYILYAISMDMSEFKPGVANVDTRSPYLEWPWHEGGYGNYTGVACGTDGTLRCDDLLAKGAKLVKTLGDNTIPYVREWHKPSDRAEAIIATRTYAELPMGSEYWGGASEPIIAAGNYPIDGEGKKDCWEMPYQIGCYAVNPEGWAAKLTWQVPFGIGTERVEFGSYSYSGYPKYSYATLIVLEKHSSGRIEALIKEQETIAKAKLTAEHGDVITEASPGPGREDETVKLAVPGYDPMLRAFRLKADYGDLFAELELGEGKLVNPTFIIDDLAGDSEVVLNGERLSKGKDYYSSYHRERAQLYITLARTLTGKVKLAVTGEYGAAYAEFPCEIVMDSYVQEFEVQFKDEAAAKKARFEMLPLYKGYEWAISSRWDDNIWTTLKMKQVMEKHGYKATWYLNAAGDKDWYGPTYDLVDPNNPGNMSKKLIKGGHAIAGHTMQHPWLESLNHNRIWWEFVGVRIDREAEGDKPVLAFGFPFGFSDELTASGDLFQDMFELLIRSGYYHGSGPECFIKMNYLPGDGADIDGRVEEILADEELKRKSPTMNIGIHVYYNTPEAWAKFEGQLAKYGGNPAWWYCNWNEYAAYRYQYHNTKIEKEVLKDGWVKVTLTRPELVELNDEIPLTFAVKGVEPTAVKKVRKSGAGMKVLEPIDGAYAFNLGHDKPRALPVKIDVIGGGLENKGEFSDIKASLVKKGAKLALSVENTGKEKLDGLRVVYRLPVAWENGVVKKHLGGVKAGSALSDSVKLVPQSEDWKYNAGKVYYVAQLDFRLGEEAGRLYVVATEEEGERDASYPRNGFYALGPLPNKRGDALKLAEQLLDGEKRAKKCVIEGARAYSWFKGGDGESDIVGAEMIMTRASDREPESGPYQFLLLSVVEAKQARVAKMLTQSQAIVAAWLNGEKLKGDVLELKKGDNELMLLFHSGSDAFAPRHFGAFLRLVDPKSEERLTDISYRPEKVEFAGGVDMTVAIADDTGETTRRVFDDFEDGNDANSCKASGISPGNGNWHPGCDELGESKIAMEIIGEKDNPSKNALHITGYRGRSQGGKHPWATVSSGFDPRGFEYGADITGSIGISFRARTGKPTSVAVMVEATVGGVAVHSIGLAHQINMKTGTEWEKYTFYWDDFAQPQWACPGEKCVGPLSVEEVNYFSWGFLEAGAEIDYWMDDIEVIYKKQTQ